MSLDNNVLPHPGMFRHLAIVFYDCLLLLAVLMLAGLIAIAFNHGQAIASDNIFFKLYLLLICFIYYGWFWTHGGQTLGMKAWKVRLITLANHTVSWQQAGIRFLCAPLSWLLLGAGFWLAWFAKDKSSLLDRCSNTRLVLEK